MMSRKSTQKRFSINAYTQNKAYPDEIKNSIGKYLKKYKSQDSYKLLINKNLTTGKNNEYQFMKNLNEKVTNNTIHNFQMNLNNPIINDTSQLSNSSNQEKFPKYLETNTPAKEFYLNQIQNKKINDDSIHELQTEENMESIDDEKLPNLDEMRTSEFITDFYTNSISEENSIFKKETKLINLVPHTFVKQINHRFVKNDEKEISNKVDIKIDYLNELNEKTSKNHNLKDKEKNMDKTNHTDNTSRLNIKSTSKLNKVALNDSISKKDNINEKDLPDNNSEKNHLLFPKSATIDPLIQTNFIMLNSANVAQDKIQEDYEKEKKRDLDTFYRRFLISAKKGDRDGFLENLETLNQLNCDINFQDESGWTALHYASDEGNLKIVDILINTYADVNSKTKNKKTPLHLSTSHGYFDISKILVENGCIINSLDDEKNTPIHICSKIGHLELLKYLLDKFPQADAKNIYGKSPLELARKEDIKSLLTEYLKKNESIYQRVPIIQANKKAVKNLFKTLNNNLNSNLINITNNPIKNKNHEQVNSNSNQKTVTSKENDHTGNITTSNSKNTHNKFASIDLEKNVNQLKAINQLGNAFQNNNININFNTNINNPKGPVNLVNLKTPLKDASLKKINLKENIKINVETKTNYETNNKNNITPQIKTVSKFINNNKMPIISSNEKTNNSKVTKKIQKASKTNKVNVNDSAYGTINNKTANNISNIEISQLNSTKQITNLNYTTYPHLSKKNNSSTENLKLNNKANKNNPNTSRNLLSLANKVEINLGVHSSAQIANKMKINYAKINNRTNTNSTKNFMNRSDNDVVKGQTYQNSSKKDTNKTYDTIANTQRNLLNITDLSCLKPNIQKNIAEESRMNKIEEYTPEEENSASAENSQLNVIDNKENYINNQSICMLSMDEVEEEKAGAGEFLCHALLGKGSFGEVYLVEKKNSNMIYAMKVLSKDKIMGQNLVKYAMTERNVLSITNHPFIVKLNYSFQTSDKLFLILDYCPGGDLALHLERENRFTEERAKIYICEITLALEDLHKRDIIFRDLKPDNVVLDKEGHALLTDFGLSKEGIFDSKSAKSFCGSIAYLAPEMLKRTGHGKAVDWYLLGVLFYEMLVGIPPFFTNNKDQLFKNIEKAELQIPNFVSEKASDLLRARNPLLRLGSGIRDAEEIKNHEYFKNVNWKDVYDRKLKPPIPLIYYRILQKFSEPHVFHDYNDHKMNSNYDMPNYFDGWSFVNNSSNQQKE